MLCKGKCWQGRFKSRPNHTSLMMPLCRDATSKLDIWHPSVAGGVKHGLRAFYLGMTTWREDTTRAHGHYLCCNGMILTGWNRKGFSIHLVGNLAHAPELTKEDPCVDGRSLFKTHVHLPFIISFFIDPSSDIGA